MPHIRPNSQRGAQLLTLALFMSAFFALVALSIGIGLASINSIRNDTSSDSAALSALETYSKEPSALVPPQLDSLNSSQRASSALSAANTVLGNYTAITGEGNSVSQGTVSLYTAGSTENYLQFGQWIVGPPISSTPGCDECCSSGYPCLKLHSSAPTDASKVTAVKTVRKTSSVQQALDYFSKLAFGVPLLNSQKTIEATAVMIPRCYVYALDVSLYSVWDSHHATSINKLGLSGSVITDPSNPALYAYNDALVSSPIFDASNPDKLYWANMEDIRPVSGATVGGHYDSDYSHIASNSRGTYRVDTYTEPQPLKTLLDGLNGAIREHTKNLTSSDKALMLVFDSQIYDRVPNSGFFDPSHDLRYLVQLTNFKNFKNGIAINSVTPNFVTRGWYPVADNSKMFYSNLPLLLRRGIEELKTMCPQGSQRNLFVATPGFINAGYDSSGNPVTFNTYADYSTFENNVILSANSTDTTGNIFTGSILEDAKDFDIRINFLYSGSLIQPNFCNRGSSPFVSIYNARREGFLSLIDDDCSSDPQAFFDSLSIFMPPARISCALGDNACSWLHLGASNSNSVNIFHKRANAVLGKLAFETGGKMCPLLPASSSYSDTSTTPHSVGGRVSGSAQTTSIKDMPPGNYGAECFNETSKERRTALIQTTQ